MTKGAIATRSLGSSGIAVSAVGFGSAPIGDLYGILDDETAVAAVSAALAGGCTLIDTSPLYGHGLAEHRVGTAIRRFGRDRIVVSTKVGRVLTPARGTWDREGYRGGLPFAATFDYSHDGALRSLEQSLLRLGTSHVEIALIHDLDGRTHGARFRERVEQAMSGAFVALRRLRDEKVVRAIGIGVNEAAVCAEFAERCEIDAVLLAGRYTLLEQGALDTFLTMALRKKIGVMVGGVFNSGILATGSKAGGFFDYAPAPRHILDRVAAIERVCGVHGVPLPVAAMHFCAAHPAVSSIVLGGASPAEVERNIGNWHIDVPSQLWSDLKSERLLRRDAPVPGAAA